jgi:hypothetical protein
MKDEPK